MNPTSVDGLLTIFENPIERISQVMRKSNLPSSDDKFCNAWGGCEPIFVFEFSNGTMLLVATFNNVVMLAQVRTEDNLLSKIVEFSARLGPEFIEDAEDVIGAFDLDSIICPVPEWSHLLITRATVVINQKSEEIIGFCLWINLGIRIGIFVAPHPGATLAFNDSCDFILDQASSAEKNGFVLLTTKEYPGKFTPQQMEEIDWFDWLRTSNDFLS